MAPEVGNHVPVARRGWGRTVFASLAVAAVAVLPVSCGTNPDAQVGYKPPILPVKFVLSSSGVTISGDRSLVTPMGTFSVGAKYSLSPSKSDSVYVIIRDKDQGETGFDQIYEVKSGQGEFTAVVNGTTTIQVRDRQVLIDVTDGKVNSIELKGVERTANISEGQGDNIVAVAESRWRGYWDTAFYTPLALFNWAYDDSTMSEAYGIGFVWFLIRLLAALVLFIGDIILTLACTIAAIATVFFGTTGRNIAYGIEALLGIFIIGGGVASIILDTW